MALEIKMKEIPELTQSQIEAIDLIKKVVLKTDSKKFGKDKCEFKRFIIKQPEGTDFLLIDTHVGRISEDEKISSFLYRYFMVMPSGAIILLNPLFGYKASGMEALTVESR